MADRQLPVHLNQIKNVLVLAFRMLRIRTVFVMITFSALGFEVNHPSHSIPFDFVLVIVMVAALYICATCLNDIADEEIDKVNLANDKSRPLVTTKTTPNQLRILAILAVLLATIAALLIKPEFLFLIIGGVILNVGYSNAPLKISYRGVLASFWLALSYVAIPFIAGSWIYSVHLRHDGWVILFAMYSFFVGRILLKDFRDYVGDKKFGKLNFLVRHGPRLTCLAAGLAWLIGDAVIIIGLRSKYPVLIYLAQPIILVILLVLSRLANEKLLKKQLLEVSVIGRLGNAIAISFLTRVTLQAFDYSALQIKIITLVVGIFIASTTLYFWYSYNLTTRAFAA